MLAVWKIATALLAGDIFPSSFYFRLRLTLRNTLSYHCRNQTSALTAETLMLCFRHVSPRRTTEELRSWFCNICFPIQFLLRHSKLFFSISRILLLYFTVIHHSCTLVWTFQADFFVCCFIFLMRVCCCKCRYERVNLCGGVFYWFSDWRYENIHNHDAILEGWLVNSLYRYLLNWKML